MLTWVKLISGLVTEVRLCESEGGGGGLTLVIPGRWGCGGGQEDRTKGSLWLECGEEEREGAGTGRWNGDRGEALGGYL